MMVIHQFSSGFNGFITFLHLLFIFSCSILSGAIYYKFKYNRKKNEMKERQRERRRARG